MSIRLMSEIFESDTLGPTERLIMLAIADHADDTGRCYPSISRLAQRTGLSERAVRGNVRALENQGYLTIHIGAGQGGSNVYFARSTPAADTPPAADAPGRKCTTPRQEVPSTPAADAPKPPITTNNHQQSHEAPAAAAASQKNPTDRERLLDAMGVGPDGITGPSGFIGGMGDMAEAAKWSEMGLTLSQQVELIREICQRQRQKAPGWAPRSFGYFTQPMADFLARKNAPAPQSASVPGSRDRSMSFLRKVAGQ